jgi:single-strand DNA-binding protein
MLNKVLLCGRITKDPELKGTEANVCSFSLAVQRDYADKNGQYATDFINLTAFGKVAEYIGKYAHKGSLVNVVGRLAIDNYQKDGATKQSTKVIVENVYLLEKPVKNEEEPTHTTNYNEVVNEDDLPF